jgi:D-serine deaminase-like pyridoxal phosphate-dependent protein
MLMDRTLDELDTPRVLVDLDLLESNIQRMAKFAADHGVDLRAATGTWQEVEPA